MGHTLDNQLKFVPRYWFHDTTQAESNSLFMLLLTMLNSGASCQHTWVVQDPESPTHLHLGGVAATTSFTACGINIDKVMVQLLK